VRILKKKMNGKGQGETTHEIIFLEKMSLVLGSDR
jgi:hypothetical protein